MAAGLREVAEFVVGQQYVYLDGAGGRRGTATVTIVHRDDPSEGLYYTCDIVLDVGQVLSKGRQVPASRLRDDLVAFGDPEDPDRDGGPPTAGADYAAGLDPRRFEAGDKESHQMQRTMTAATRMDRRTDALNHIDAELNRNLRATLAAIENEAEAEANTELDAVDRQGLRERIRELRARVQAGLPPQ